MKIFIIVGLFVMLGLSGFQAWEPQTNDIGSYNTGGEKIYLDGMYLKVWENERWKKVIAVTPDNPDERYIVGEVTE